MKIRTDFVTNSSSSSFIFKENNMHRLKQRVLKYIQKNADKFDYEMFNRYYGGGAEIFNVMCGQLLPIREHPLEDILEVYNWYSEDILSIAVYGHHPSDKEPKKVDQKELCQMISDKALSENAALKLTGIIALEYLQYWRNRERFHFDWGFTYSDSVQRNDKDHYVLTTENIQEHLWHFFECQDLFLPGSCFYQFIEVYLSELENMLKHYAGMTIGEILEEVIDAHYMYFDYQETHYLYADAIIECPECLFGCNHMG